MTARQGKISNYYHTNLRIYSPTYLLTLSYSMWISLDEERPVMLDNILKYKQNNNGEIPKATISPRLLAKMSGNGVLNDSASASDGQSGMVGGQPGMVGGQPGMVGGQTGMVGGQPGMVGGQPGMAGGQAGMAGGQSGMAGGQPGMVGGQVGMMGGATAALKALLEKSAVNSSVNTVKNDEERVNGTTSTVSTSNNARVTFTPEEQSYLSIISSIGGTSKGVIQTQQLINDAGKV